MSPTEFQALRMHHEGIRSFYMGIMLVFASFSLWAQPGNPSYSLSTSTYFEIDMQSIALLDIENAGATTNFSLDVPAPTEAGKGLSSNPLVSYSDNWLNYSCAARDVTSRNIQVSISSGSIPPGLELQLTVSAATGSGAGTLGTPVATNLLLTSTAQNIITGIRGSYTGNGSGNGHQLTYELHFDGVNFDQLDKISAPITILYTIIDN